MALIPDPALGENTRIIINGHSMAYVDGDVSSQPEKKDTGCNLTGGATTVIATRDHAEGNFTAQLDLNQPNPASGEGGFPVLIEGTDGTEMQIYPDQVNFPNLFWDFPLFYVQKSSMRFDGVGIITYSFSFENQGIYGTPNSPIA